MRFTNPSLCFSISEKIRKQNNETMKNEIKIAIPTDDGMIVRSRFSSARGFMVATINSGQIIHKEIRWNLLSEMITSKDQYFYNLADCDIVLVKEVGPAHARILENRNILIGKTEEPQLMEAFLQYLKRMPQLFKII